METLINITTIPIEYELNIHHPKLQYTHPLPEMEINRTEGGLSIETRPIKAKIDTYDARNSVCPTTMESVRQYAEKGKTAASEATAAYAKEGALLLDAKVSNPLDQIISQRAQMPTGEFGLKFIPTTGPNIQWSEPDINIQYEMDRLTFDLKVAKGDFEFTPGDVELVILQMPEVKIEYTGAPIYVPPSAAEIFNHKPVNVLA